MAQKTVAITGAKGIVGSVLATHLQSVYNLVTIDKEDADLTDYLSLEKVIPTHTDVIVHCAWDPDPIYERGVFNESNFVMMHNVFEVAQQKKVKRVIVASSVHANEYRLSTHHSPKKRTLNLKQESDPRFHEDDNKTDWPTSIYGATKLYFEALGRYYAMHHNLEVVAVRLGGVNKKNSPTAIQEPYYDTIFLSHADLVRVVKMHIDKLHIRDNFECVYATTKLYHKSPARTASARRA